MPMGPSVGGFVYFAGAKFLGYSAFAHFLRKKWTPRSLVLCALVFFRPRCHWHAAAFVLPCGMWVC
jgi:hypothetical protein